jgi:hypothetical protein
MTTGRIAAHYDARSRIVRVIPEGIWTDEIMTRHFDELRSLFARSRAENGRVRVLSDMRGAGVQQQGITRRINDFADQYHEAHDRLAVIVSSSIVKLQIRRIVTKCPTEAFLSPSAAETWLLAYDIPHLAQAN